LASSVSRKTWNAVCAKTRLGEFFKNPIDMLHAHCLRKALETKRAGLIMGQERISVTFDRRVQSLVSWNWMTLGFVDRAPERFAGYSFGESENILPLQAADMIAYESFVYQCDWMKKGTQPKLRPNFGRLMNSLERNMGFFTERQLVDYAQDVEARVARRRQS
jgi:hypothetical protein